MNIRNILIILIASAAILTIGISQNPVLNTPARDRDIDRTAYASMLASSDVINYPATNIGPTVMSGRVSDIAVNPNDPSEFYVAYASGGLWYTNNNGISFTPKFDDQSVMTIGDIAVHWGTHTVYVGTGEVNSSRSSYAGNGIYKSVDSCKTWTYLGLPESHHIGRILIDNEDYNRLYVAVLGKLYSPNVERGFYLSKDGGKTWAQTLFVNENTGGIDLIQDSRNDNVLYGATWQRARRAWNFEESGEGSGIYKSTDRGQSWSLISNSASNFPRGEGIGRIGLSLSYEGDTPHLYAILDNYNRRPKEKEEDDKDEGLTKKELKKMSSDQFLKLKTDDIEKYLRDNNFPDDYTGAGIKKMVKKEEATPMDLATYNENANALLFDTDVIGAEVYLSTNEGLSFEKTYDGYIDRLFNSYGYYFAQVRAEPNNPSTVYIMGVPILRSDDKGATWKNINGANVHADHHALWINPALPKHIINGNDGGINISYDKGEHWIKANTPSVGQFYYINVDYAEPYNVYAGAQDNGVWVGPHNYRESVRWHQTGQYPYESIMGGDGMQVQIDRRDNKTIYTGFQFGNYFRIKRNSGQRTYITPKHKLGETPYRWNWQTPILLSPHNQDIVYMGAHRLLRSMDKGDNFKAISQDLTMGGQKGDVAYGTLTCIDESYDQFGKIVTGSDDGMIYLTTDAGGSWKNISKDLPIHLWVSRVIFSREDDDVIYASLNGYRWDDFTAYLYRSEDNGDSWTRIGSNLPTEPINVIKEDPSDARLLYVGTDHGLYISLDKGSTFVPFAESMPNVAVHDVVIQEEAGHLLVGTHGRSIYKMDLTPLRERVASMSNIYVNTPKKMRHSDRWGKRSTIYSEVFTPSFDIEIFGTNSGKANLTIHSGELELVNKTYDAAKGYNSFDYDLSLDKKNAAKLAKDKDIDTPKPSDNGLYYLPKGEYDVKVTINGYEHVKKFELK